MIETMSHVVLCASRCLKWIVHTRKKNTRIFLFTQRFTIQLLITSREELVNWNR